MPVDRHREHVLRREDDLGVTLEDRLVLGLEVDGDDGRPRAAVRAARQARLEQRQMTARAQDETQHDLAGGGEGEDEVLQLAPAGAPRRRARGRSRRRRPARRGMSRCSGCSCRPHARRSTPFAIGVEDPDGDGAGASADDELGLVAEGGLGAGEGFEPDDVRCGVGQGELAAAVLVGELDGIRHAHEGARAAPAGVEVVALHRRQGYGSAQASRTTGRRPEGSPTSRQSDIMSIIGVMQVHA